MKKPNRIAMVVLALIAISCGLMAMATGLFHHKYQPGDSDSFYQDRE